MGSCERCGAVFPSRNKLFKHLKAGCATAGAAEQTDGTAAGPSTELQLSQLVARLAAQQGGVLEAARVGVLLSRYHGELLKRYHREREVLLSAADSDADADSSWLAACAAAHPDLLTLERVGELQVRCNDELALAASAAAAADSGAGAVVNAEAAEAAAQRLREKVCKKACSCKERTADGWIGVPWMVRGVEARLASYAMLAPRADLARAADPGRFCLSNASEEQLARRNFRRRKGGVSWSVLTAHFRVFAVAEATASSDPLWEWSEDTDAATAGQLYAEGSCYMAKLRLTVKGQAMGAGPGPDAGADAQSGGKQQQVGASAASTEGGKQAVEVAAALDPLALEPGTVLLMVAGQSPRSRIGAAVALELRLCALHHGIGPERLCILAPGLWALLPVFMQPTSGNAVAVAGGGSEGLLEEMGRLAAVRRAPLRLLNASTDVDSMAAAEAAAAAAAIMAVDRSAGLTLERQSWGLEVESLYPENVPARLPYMHAAPRPGSVFGYAIALSARLAVYGHEGDCDSVVGGLGQHSQTDLARRRLVAIECTADAAAAAATAAAAAAAGATAVSVEDKVEDGSSNDHGGAEVGAGGRGRLLLAVEEQGRTPLCEMAWWRRWQRRTHNFEGALDLHLAVVAVNIARYVALARRQRQPQPHCPAGATGGDGEAAAQSKEKDGRGLTLLDPCTGTGTLGAAAIGCGGWDRIVMTEIREDWAAKARENLDTCSALADEATVARVPPPSDTEVYAHDATLPFSQIQGAVESAPLAAAATTNTAEPEPQQQQQPGRASGAGLTPGDVDAVVMNPPWGKRIGNLSLENAEDGAIVRSLLSQFRSSVFVIIAPSLDTCLEGYGSSNSTASFRSGRAASSGGGDGEGGNDSRVSGWEVLHALKIGGKIVMHVLVPTASTGTGTSAD